MLKLLLKHEIKSMGKVLIPFYTILTISSIFLGIIFSTIDFNSIFSESVFNFFRVAGIILLVAILIAINIITFYYTATRMYRNILGNQGYLMNAIPVSVDKHIISKILIAFFYNMLTTIFSGISILLFVQFNKRGDIGIFMSMIESKLVEAYNLLGNELYVYIIEMIVLCIVSMIAGILTVYISICVGHLFKRRIIASVIFYVIFSSLNFLFSQVIDIISKKYSGYEIIYLHTLSDLKASIALHGMIISYIVQYLLISIIFYSACRYILTNKMNLK